MPDYDVIVVGLGAMGSASVYHLARRGQRVLGLDAFPAGHSLGSSHGESRIIRMAYFEHPDYVPLLRRAYELWAQLETEASTKLLEITGGLFIGPPDGDLVAGSTRSAEIHALPHALLDADEIRRRFPMFRPRDDEVAFFEDRAGVLRPERCIDALQTVATLHGATLRHAEPVLSWTADQNQVVVESNAGRYEGAKLIVTAGAWAGKLLRSLHLPLQPERIPLLWLEPIHNAAQFELGRMPVWIWQDPQAGDFYGVPHLNWSGVKIGKHHSQTYVDPDAVDREIHPADEAPILEFLQRRVPDLAGRVEQSKVCLYTNTPDLHFIVDRHPERANVAYAAGFSGHGFKFTPVIGEILADVVLTGSATPAAKFLQLKRLSDPKTAAGASR